MISLYVKFVRLVLARWAYTTQETCRPSSLFLTKIAGKQSILCASKAPSMEEGLFEFRRPTLRHDFPLSSLRKFCSSDESSVHEAVGFPQAEFLRSFSPQQPQLPRLPTHDRIGSWPLYVFIRPISTPREPSRTYGNPVEKLRLPLYDQLQVKDNVDSR